MVKLIIFKKDGRVRVHKFTSEQKIRNTDIINALYARLKQGELWKLKFINSDSGEKARWRSYEKIARIRWQNDLPPQKLIEHNTLSVTFDQKNLSSLPKDVPIRSLQIAELIAVISTEFRIHFIEGGEVIYIPTSTKTFKRETD